MSKKSMKHDYDRLLGYLEYTLHELPAGVLYDANGADANGTGHRRAGQGSNGLLHGF